ncbi:uncharacterized protein LOC143551730 [Bidens hawaiensis]|uniref:uncharacterized protein LOC143551730 n=1 Tax=Bidens hawaiensis TaxID=980011 RepID=UPI0040498C72
MDFPEWWCRWIFGVVSSARSSILVNGAPTFEFDCGKGLRQGDPISPFLFIIVMEALSGLINKACLIGALNGVVLKNGGPVLSHLLYADNAMIMGISVGANMNRVSNWDPVVKVFKTRLSKWKAITLSIGGRVTLIKLVLESLPTYYFSIYKAPIGVIKKLEVLIKKFLWGGGGTEGDKVHWLAWDKVTLPKRSGGLGLSTLDLCDNALLLKWMWRYRDEYEALWRKAIDAIHGSKRKWDTVPCNRRIPGTWSRLVAAVYRLKVQDEDVYNMFRGIVGNGRRIRFWIDSWVTQMPLRSLFPYLFRLEKDKWCFVADRIGLNNDLVVVSWSWNRYPTSDDHCRELVECQRLVDGIRLSNKEDGWKWNDGSNEIFSVAMVKKWLKGEELLWKARNELIFSSKRRGVVEIVSDVKSMGYLWYRSRVKTTLVD